MSIFLLDHERELINEHRQHEPLNRFYWGLRRRAEKRVEMPGLIEFNTTVHWWHAAVEYTTDVAMAYALNPDDTMGRWLRDVTLSLVRRSLEDWVGPDFRDHSREPRIGHLETAHLSLAVAAALDLAPDIFTASEIREIKDKLREEAIPLCLRWLDNCGSLNNWFAILNFGVATAAAVLDDRANMDRAAEYQNIAVQAFQPDGSYTESLQYSNYAAKGMMWAYEALVRRNPSYKDKISAVPYARSARWSAYSFLYNKPLTGWGPSPMPRSANFNDSAAIHRPTADVLLHFAVRTKDELPLESGLARWLFDTVYAPPLVQKPYDVMSFGFFNQYGFLTIPLLPQACEAISPEAADLPPVAHFSCGDTLVRDQWDSPTVLAIHGGGDPMYGPGHLHGDLNSFILVHNQTRLLVDPGHACYRNMMRELDIATRQHNTCTFLVESADGSARQEDLLSARFLEQSTSTRRTIDGNEPGPPPERGGKHLLDAKLGPVKVVGSEAAKLYGPPIETFMRFWFMVGEHALFVVDHIVSSQPVKTTWNWLLNNRDGTLDLKLVRPDRLVARRGDAGMKLFHLGGGVMQGPNYGYMHDMYHPLPNQNGEGKPGSSMIIRWQERQAATVRTVVHAIPVDHYGAVAGWHLRQEGGKVGLEAPGGSPLITLTVENDPLAFSIHDGVAAYRVTLTDDTWTLVEDN